MPVLKIKRSSAVAKLFQHGLSTALLLLCDFGPGELHIGVSEFICVSKEH